jgi:hypothetical protein
VNCVHSKKPVPSPIPELSSKIREDEREFEAPVNELASVMMQYAKLEADIATKVVTEAAAITSGYLEIDARLLDWPETLPPSWAVHEKLADFESPDIFGNSYLVYDSLKTAAIWSNYRAFYSSVLRAIIDTMNETVKASFPNLPPTYVQVYRNYEATIARLSAEVQASTFYHLHVNYKADSDPETKGQAIGGYFFLWSVFAVGFSGRTTQIPKEWAVGKLKDIGSSMGMPHALALAKLLKKIPEESKEYEALWRKLELIQSGSK